MNEKIPHYIPSSKEIKKAEDMMTDEQKKMSGIEEEKEIILTDDEIINFVQEHSNSLGYDTGAKEVFRPTKNIEVNSYAKKMGKGEDGYGEARRFNPKPKTYKRGKEEKRPLSNIGIIIKGTSNGRDFGYDKPYIIYKDRQEKMYIKALNNGNRLTVEKFYTVTDYERPQGGVEPQPCKKSVTIVLKIKEHNPSQSDRTSARSIISDYSYIDRTENVEIFEIPLNDIIKKSGNN